MLFVYLLVCRNSKILAHVYLRFIKVNFPFTKRGGGVSGENCHFRLRSTTSGPHFDPHDTHSLRHMTQMNELKMKLLGIRHFTMLDLETSTLGKF